jgi:XTP/dITP diphosphohydrolase
MCGGRLKAARHIPIDEFPASVYLEGMHIVLATNNHHKLRELRGILPDCQVSAPKELGIDFDHDETGTSFMENALGKATTLWRLIAGRSDLGPGMLVLADDSGLVVPALDGAPGVWSARYGDSASHRPLDDRGRYELLLSNMRNVADRRAHFICCLALVQGADRFSVIQETWEGAIATAPMDTGQGFGYDPVFWLPEYNCTVACLPADEKNRVSHRAKAMNRLVPCLRDL